MSGMLVVVVAAAMLGGDELPKALRELEEARRKIDSGTIEWGIARIGDPTHRWEKRYRFRLARGGDLIFEELGNRDGVTRWDQNGSASSHAPQFYMLNEDGFWDRNAATTSATLWRGARNAQERLVTILDPRRIAFTEFDRLEYDETGLRFRPAWPRRDGSTPEIKWSERVLENGLHEVTASVPEQGYRRVWQIDPKRGWNPVKVVKQREDGSLDAQIVVELKKFDDRWFPCQVDYFARRLPTVEDALRGVKESPEPIIDHETRLTVTAAAFNRKDSIQKYTGADLGLEVGSNIHYRGGKPSATFPGKGSRGEFWTGDRAVPYEQFRKLHLDGKITLGPVSAALYRGEEPPTPYMTPEEREAFLARSRETKYQMWRESTAHRWKRYVDRVAEAAAFDDTQKSSAKAVLEDCNRRARERTEKLKPDYVKYVANLAAAKKANDVKTIERLDKQKAEFDKTLSVIEMTELVPRIRALLTAEQRPKVAEIEP